MHYNVAQLLKESIGASRDYPIEGTLEAIDELNPEAVPVEGRVNLTRTESGILARGKACASLHAECVRCLEPFDLDIQFKFEEEYVPSIDVETGATLPVGADSPELVISDHHMLDLTEVLRQYVVVEMASTALCRPDCKGLCSQCGQNLNLGTCGCEQESIDPRLDILRQLLYSAQGQDERNIDT